MDRKRKETVIRYLIVYLIFAVLFSLGMYLIGVYEEQKTVARMALLLENHPELEGEIISIWEKPTADDAGADYRKTERIARLLEETYGYDFFAGDSLTVIRCVWALGLLLGIAVCAALLYLDRRKRRSRTGDEARLRQLYECLQAFREGEFQIAPAAEQESEQWMEIRETLRELGQYFSDMKERLRREEDSTKRLITDISHQLKTPLASLRMSHELVADQRMTGEEKKEFLAQEAREIDKLEQLLDELVNLSRLESHMIQLRPLTGSLKKTLTEAISQNYMKAREKGISICAEMPEDMAVSHDARWTVEAFSNLLENAVKYSPKHSVVTVRTRRLARNILVEVEDEGMGIPPEELHMIYQRFYRGSRAKEQVKDGAGVGLYLARRIIEEQGGTITAKRKAEAGTIFQVTLPAVIGE